MLLDKVQRLTAELFCFSVARNHFTVHVISNVGDSTIYGLLKKENEIFYPASSSKRSFSNYDVKMR